MRVILSDEAIEAFENKIFQLIKIYIKNLELLDKLTIKNQRVKK